MIICNHCGAPVPERASFCGECGTPNVPSQGGGGGTRPVYPPPPQPEPLYPPGPPVYPAPPTKSNTGLILGVLAVVIVGGIGLFALAINSSRRSSSINVDVSTPTNNRNAYNSSGNTNANQNGNYNSSNANRANTNYNSNYNTNYNGGSVTPYQRAENKILSQDYLSVGEISGLDCYDLKLLRNTFFAKYGRIFDEPELQTYFGGKSWYRPNYEYYSNTQDPGITARDKANIEVVKMAEDSKACRRGR